MRRTVSIIVCHPYFKNTLSILAVFFIISSFFITVSPDFFISLGYLGIFIFNAVSSGLLLIPILVQKMNLVGVVFFSALGNIINTSINYLLGYNSKSMFAGNHFIGFLKHIMRKYGLFAVYVLAIVPMPLDVNGLLSGYMNIPYKQYIVVNFLGKVTIFLLVGIGFIAIPKFLQ